MNYGKDIIEYTKFSCNSMAMPLLIQISLCLISCTLSGYAASIIVLRFTLLNKELLTTSFTLIFLVRNNKISLTVNQISLSFSQQKLNSALLGPTFYLIVWERQGTVYAMKKIIGRN